MKVANFTPDDIQWTHVGISGWIRSGEIKEYDERRANHILNKFGRRGVTRLDWYDPNDDPDYMERKKAEAMKQYKAFWEYTIQTFNQNNETQKNEGRPFISPSEQYKEKAKELGIRLIGPWTITNQGDTGSSAEMIALRQKNESLEKSLNETQAVLKTLQESMQALTAHMLTKPVNEDAKSGIETGYDFEVEKAKFIKLSANTIEGWITKHRDEINQWPADILNALMEKYENVKGEAFDPMLLVPDEE